MTSQSPQDPPDAPHDWPRTVAEAVARLAVELGRAEKDAIAAKPEANLIELHFSPLGAHIREGFGLWQGNDAARLADCQRARLAGGADAESLSAINPDAAAMAVARALWGRLGR